MCKYSLFVAVGRGTRLDDHDGGDENVDEGEEDGEYDDKSNGGPVDALLYLVNLILSLSAMFDS